MAEQTRTEQRQTSEQTRLEKVLVRLETIEDQAQQWMINEEHGTEHNMDRRTQLDNARAYFKRIMAELKEAYHSCPTYAGGAE